MGGGGGGDTKSTVTQTNLPEYAQPYYTALLTNAQGVSKQPYTPYTGQQEANYSPASAAAATGIGALPGQTAPLFDASRSGFEAQGQQFDTTQASKYMSPYMQNVVDYQKSQAIRDDGIAQLGRDAAAVKAGAFGGDRAILQDTEAKRALGDRLAGIEANGSQNAFTNAQGQFNADRTAAGQSAAGIASLGSTINTTGITDYNAMNTLGQQKQAWDQQGLTDAYNNFVNQRDYEKNQLGWLSGILHGSTVGANSDVISTTPNPSLISQLGGLGIGSLALSKAAA